MNVMATTALLGLDRARMRQTSPSPVQVFEVLSLCFQEALAASAMRLPTLQECQHQFEVATQVAS